MSQSGKSKVEKDKSLSIPELLADFFLKKIGMPSDSDDSDHKHKSKKKKSKHKKRKQKKSKHRHKSSSSDTSKTSNLNKKEIVDDFSSAEEMGIKRLKKIKSLKLENINKSASESTAGCEKNDKNEPSNSLTKENPIFYGPSLELLLSGIEPKNSDQPKNSDSSKFVDSTENKNSKLSLNVIENSIKKKDIECALVKTEGMSLSCVVDSVNSKVEKSSSLENVEADTLKHGSHHIIAGFKVKVVADSNSKDASVSKMKEVHDSKKEVAANLKTGRLIDSKAKTVANSNTKAVADSNTKAVAESKTKAVTDSVNKAVTDSVNKAVTDSVTKAVADSKTKAVAYSITKAFADSITKAVANSKTKAVADSLTKAVADSKTKAVADSKTKAVADSKIEGIDDSKSEEHKSVEKNNCDMSKNKPDEKSSVNSDFNKDEKNEHPSEKDSKISKSKEKSREKRKHSKSRSRSRSRSKYSPPKSKHKRRTSRSSSRDSYSASKKRKRYSRSRSRERLRDRRRRSRSRSPLRSRHSGRRNVRSRSPHDRYRRRSRSRSHSRTRNRKRSESRSRRRSRSRQRHRSSSKSRYGTKSSRRSRSRSRSKSKSKLKRTPSPKKKSRSRSKSKEKKSNKIDQAKILETARKNVLKMMKSGTMPEGLPVENLKKEQLISIQAGGKSVQELTDFCQRLSQKENEPDVSDNDDKPDDETGFIHHPFKVKEPAVIKLNIKNAVQLPIKTHAQKIAETTRLSSQFPVSSGNQHKQKELEWVPVVPESSKTEAKPTETVVSTVAETKSSEAPPEVPVAPIPPPPPPPPISYPVPPCPPPLEVPQVEVLNPVPALMPPPPPPPTCMSLALQQTVPCSTFYQIPPAPPEMLTYTAPSEPMMIPFPPTPPAPESTAASTSIFKPPRKLDIPAIVAKRFQALTKLQEDPNDPEAIKIVQDAQESIQEWVQSQQVPGLFTGSTDAKMLSAAELCGPFRYQKFKKDFLFNAPPVTEGKGMSLLKKMGWNPGEGLGKNKEGSLEPLVLDIKTDKKGLVSTGENSKKNITSFTNQLQGKHPVSALMELCSKRKWKPPLYTCVLDQGPAHKKVFCFKVEVNGVEYQPLNPSLNKKVAKADAAVLCLQSLNILPKTS